METPTLSHQVEKPVSKQKLERILGVYTKGAPGPTIICITGMHGNEPAGVIAFQHVLSQLNQTSAYVSGTLVGLIGNIRAQELSQRFVQRDLNREWTAKNILSIQFQTDKRAYVEAREQRELYGQIHNFIEKRTGPVYFIDLHTTSAESQPYISINDTLRNRNLALKYPLPIVLGLEEYLDGTVLSYINQLGHVALGFEGGQHNDPAAVTNLESVIWLSLYFDDCISKEQIPNLHRHFNVLSKDIVEGKNIYEVRHRHWVTGDEQFKMKEGYVNFQPIHKNELLATDMEGDIKAPERGRIFMPLYQSQGNDGFFIIRPIKWIWLKISAFLRKTRFHRLLHLLPGVNKHQGLHYTLVVNTHVARWYVRDFFHLMGFRMKRKEGAYTIFTKREFDVDEPY